MPLNGVHEREPGGELTFKKTLEWERSVKRTPIVVSKFAGFESGRYRELLNCRRKRIKTKLRILLIWTLIWTAEHGVG